MDFLTQAGEGHRGRPHTPRSRQRVSRAREAFRDALASDLNTAAGLAALFDLVRDGNAAIDAQRR